MKQVLILVFAVMTSVAAFGGLYLYEANDDGDNTITLTALTAHAAASEVNIPSVYEGRAVTRIGEGFGSEDWKISRVVLPVGVREVGRDAFSNCSGLRDLRLPEGLEVIRKGAFSGCALNEISLPSTVFIVEEKAFTKCPVKEIAASNRSVYVQGGVLYCSGEPWSEDLIAVVSCREATDVTLASGCTEIGDNAFAHGDWGSELRSVVFSAELEKVGHDAFSGCANLAEADFSGTKLKKICEDAFRRCTALRRVTFPATLKEIYGHCFEDCTALAEVMFHGDVPEVVPNDDPDEEMLDQIYVQKQKISGIPHWSYLENPVTLASDRAKGWDDMCGMWQGRPLRVVNVDPFALPFGPFVPGVDVKLVFPELIGYKAKGLPYGLRLVRRTGEIVGSPRRPTPADGTLVAFTKRGAETISAVFVVAPIPLVTVVLNGDVDRCKVTGGNKAYLAGKRVMVKARGPRGTAFTGWFQGDEPWPNAAEYLNASQKFVMPPEDVSLSATFEKEKMSIDSAALESAAFRVGVEVLPGEVPVEVGTMSGLKSLNAKSLPRGLRLSKNRVTGVWSVRGKPRVQGVFAVKLKATAKSGAVEEKTIAVSVAE